VRYKGHIRHFGHQTMGRQGAGARSALTGAESLQDIWNRVARLGRRCGTSGVQRKVCSGGGEPPWRQTPTAVTLAFMRRGAPSYLGMRLI
jgi:hypothetical protein